MLKNVMEIPEDEPGWIRINDLVGRHEEFKNLTLEEVFEFYNLALQFNCLTNIEICDIVKCYVVGYPEPDETNCWGKLQYYINIVEEHAKI